jgi:predicted ferric reductase
MSNASTIKYSSGAGVDWAALIAGLGLGLTVAMQVTTMTYTDISSVYALITSFSRLCALVGTYFAILGIFLIARIPFVERGVGHDRLVTWHRKLAPYSLFLIGFHVFFIIFGFAGQDQIPLYKELWNMLTKFYWMWAALGGFVLMILAGVTSYKKARAKMSYETWWIIHIYTYAAIALSFMHQVLNGSMFVGHSLNRWYWTALYVLMGASVL